MKHQFKKLNKSEFSKIWGDKWHDMTSYTRLLFLIPAENTSEESIKEFITERPFLNLAFIKNVYDDFNEENIFWVFIHSNSEFHYLHEDLTYFSATDDGFRIEAIDIDNKIIQKYSNGDVDTGMYFDIDPEDFDPTNNDYEDYYETIEDRILRSPIKIVVNND